MSTNTTTPTSLGIRDYDFFKNSKMRFFVNADKTVSFYKNDEFIVKSAQMANNWLYSPTSDYAVDLGRGNYNSNTLLGFPIKSLKLY